MSLRYSEKIRNAGVDARVAAIGESPTLQIFDRDHKRLASLQLPKVWMTKAENGIARRVGIWSAAAERKGEAYSFSIHDSSDAAHMTGDIPTDMTLEDPKLVPGQSVIVASFALVAGNQ